MSLTGVSPLTGGHAGRPLPGRTQNPRLRPLNASQGLGSYNSIISSTRGAVRSLVPEPAALTAATLAAGKCSARLS